AGSTAEDSPPPPPPEKPDEPRAEGSSDMVPPPPPEAVPTASEEITKEMLSKFSSEPNEKCLPFELAFLSNYLRSSVDLGPLFHKKIYSYFSTIPTDSTRQITFQYYAKDPAKVILQLTRLNFASCILDYLEDKYIIFMPQAIEGRKSVSKILTVDELKECQRAMLREITEICSLISDEETLNFIRANIGTNENMANCLFASQLSWLQTEPSRRATKVLVTIDPTKKPMSRVSYDFLAADNTIIFSTKVEKKAFGAQFGGIISKYVPGATESASRFFFKTHQDGSRFTGFTGTIFMSKEVSLAKPVNLRELFVYKVLERIGLGPEVLFIINPFVNNDLYIVTKDLTNSDAGQNFTIAGKLGSEVRNSIKVRPEVVLQFTMFDLLNRIFALGDLNEGNYGILSEPDADGRLFVKVLDFRAPSQANYLNARAFLRSFLQANGEFYKPQSVAKTMLANRKPEEKIMTGLEALRIINGRFQAAVTEAKDEILTFMSDVDEINGLLNQQIVGVRGEAIGLLDEYAEAVLENFQVVSGCLNSEQEKILQKGSKP
ncbi:MAG: hypothetical protein LBF82_04200, partial [Lactobacillales bacterium]|nr:hypothetical protein [Lactobacillales bacterium]